MGTIGYDSTVGLGGVTSTTATNQWVNYEFPGESLVAAAGERVIEVGFHHEGSTDGDMQVGVFRKDTLALVDSATVNGTGAAGRKITVTDWPLVDGVEYIVGFRIISSVSQYRVNTGTNFGRYSAATGVSTLEDPFVPNLSTAHKFAVFATTEIVSSGDSVIVDHAEAVFQGQTVVLAIAAPLIHAQAAFQGQNIGTASGGSEVELASFAQAVFESQEINFIFGVPGDHAEAAFEGQQISFGLRFSGTAGEGVWEGQEVPLSTGSSVTLIVEHADAVFAPSVIGVTSTGIVANDDMVEDDRTIVRPMAFSLTDTDR